uniref:Non-specific lipid-transfer protein n=1 Tax=Nelumbo nucifera TaxID=4432 RepID=A0A822Z1S1_NELNU|nr:TPA_asm: hypothetical protein HUJ06_012952 [Nelumbo nucifera]
MSGRAVVVKLFCAVVMGGILILVVDIPSAEAALQCKEVETQLRSCLPYLTQNGRLTGDCCKAVKLISVSVKTVQDRRATCKCILDAYKESITRHGFSYNLNRAAQLPTSCGVTIPNISIKPSIVCSTLRN